MDGEAEHGVGCRVMTLKELVLSSLVQVVGDASRAKRSDVDGLKQVASYLHVLPARLLTDFNNTLVEQEDLDNYQVVLMIYPTITALNLDECMRNDVPFDLDFVVQCSKENLQHLTEMHFLTGSVIQGPGFRAFCHAAPNLKKLVLHGCEISEDVLSDLATYCPNLEVLNLRNTPVTSRGFQHLCGDNSRLKQGLTTIDVRGTMLGMGDIKTCLQVFSMLTELDTDHCLFDCLFDMHGNAVLHDGVSETPKYHLNEIHSTFYRGVNVDAINLVSILCSNVRSIDLNFFSLFWVAEETFQPFKNFKHLRDLSFSFKLPANNVVLFEIMGPILETLSPQLECLRLVRVGESASTDGASRRWHFDFRRLQMLLLYGIPEYPFSRTTLESFLQSCMQLKVLTCYFVDGNDLIDILTNSQLARSLEEITLRYCSISIEALKNVLKFPYLKMLTLYDCLSARDNDVIENITVPDDLILTII